MLAGVTGCRRSQKWGCRGRLVLGFKPRSTSQTREKTVWLWQRRGRGSCSFGRVNREDHTVFGEKRKDHAALAEWGPCGCNTADGAWSLNHRLLLLFLRYSIPDWAEGTVCIGGYSKGL